MVFGCGIDIEEVVRFNKHYFDKGILSNLVYDLFTRKEIENFSVFGKEAFLKGFSFKEAFYKAINNSDIDFKDIEIIFTDERKFEILTSHKVDRIFKSLGINNIDAKFIINEQYVVFKVILIKD